MWFDKRPLPPPHFSITSTDHHDGTCEVSTRVVGFLAFPWMDRGSGGGVACSLYCLYALDFLAVDLVTEMDVEGGGGKKGGKDD